MKFELPTTLYTHSQFARLKKYIIVRETQQGFNLRSTFDLTLVYYECLNRKGGGKEENTKDI